MERQPRTTNLNHWHRRQGAAMTVFHGWEMPLWYPHGAVAEHRSVITNAGVFDTSHMSVLVAAGFGARELLQRCFTRDLDLPPCATGKSLFGAFLDEQGYAVDDAVVYILDSETYMITVNAGMGGKVSDHLNRYVQDLNVRISDLTGNVGKLDLQGPMSGRILARVLKDPKGVLQDLGYFTFKGCFLPEWDSWKIRLTNGDPVLVSRTGYTGEFGFELFVQAQTLELVWEMILEAGKDMGVLTCGLAARDSLRTGAVLPLSGQDFGPWPFINHPWHAVLPFTERLGAATNDRVGLGLPRTLIRGRSASGPMAGRDGSTQILSDGDRCGRTTVSIGDEAGSGDKSSRPEKNSNHSSTEGERGFTKRFVGDIILAERDRADHTYPFVGYDPRKVSVHDPAVVLDGQGQEIGIVLTCVVDMAVSRHDDRIYSMASPDKPDDFLPRGLCCGFVKVKSRLEPGQRVELKDKRRRIVVVIVDDIRPDRTARRPMWEMI